MTLHLVRHRFANGPGLKDSDSPSWLTGLTRVESNPTSPPPQQKASTPTSPPAAPQDREDLHALVREQRRAIESLESEKASLSERLHGLSQVESSTLLRSFREGHILSAICPEFQHAQELLQSERARTEQLEKTVQELRARSDELSQEAQKQRSFISSLEAEKAALARSTAQQHAALEKSRSSNASTYPLTESAFAEANESETALANERATASALRDQVESLERSLREYEERVEQQQQTISLLVSEKASLSAAVERLESAESGG